MLSVTDFANNYCQELVEKFEKEGFRAAADVSSEKIGKKIRDAESMKIPYMAIVGKKEAEEGTISLRKHTVGDTGSLKFGEIVENLRNEVLNKS